MKFDIFQQTGGEFFGLRIFRANFRRDRESRRHRNFQRIHLGEIRALPSEQIFHRSIAFGEVEDFFHFEKIKKQKTRESRKRVKFFKSIFEKVLTFFVSKREDFSERSQNGQLEKLSKIFTLLLQI